MVAIYILKCINDKYYIGKTNDCVKYRFKKHKKGRGAIWTKKYIPVEILKVYNNCDNFDEDKYTKIYMDKYGIDNVRGGSYTKLKLNNNTIEFLQKELLSIHDKCYGCGEKGHFIRDCIKYKNNINNYNDNSLNFADSDYEYCSDSDSDYYSDSDTITDKSLSDDEISHCSSSE